MTRLDTDCYGFHMNAYEDLDLCPVCREFWLDDDGECDYCLGLYDPDSEPEMSFQYEHDSSMTSVGWGTDEDYGYYGDDFEGGY